MIETDIIDSALFMAFADLGAVFVGFIAIVLAAVNDDGKLSVVDALRARSILHSGLNVIVGGLAPLAANSYGLDVIESLRLAALISFLMGFGLSIEGMIYNLRMDKADRKKAGYIHGALNWSFVLLSGVLLIAAITGIGNTQGHYILALSLMIFVAGSNFVMIALQKWLTDT